MAPEDTDVVDLSEKKLDKIPEEVFMKCDSIRILNLSGNYAIRLDHSLKFFGNVIKLVLSRCAFSTIPDVISELTKLEELDLSENDFSRGLNAVLRRLGQLKKLQLSRCKLSSLPDWIGALEQLELLTLTDNDFSGGLNPAVGRLRRLKTLELGRCKLESLPDSIGDLQQLEKLDLYSPEMPSHRLSFGDLWQTYNFTVKNNDFSGGLNPALGRLGQLKELNLQSCMLTSLPESIGDLEQLKHLTLLDNDFSGGLTPAVRRLGRLKSISLQSCKITSLPEAIGDLEQLEDLDISRNDFSSGLNAVLGRLGQLKLKSLNLSSCRLSSLPDCIGALEQLELLTLTNNDFSGGLNPAVGLLRRLKTLDLCWCKLERLPDSIGHLQQLEILTCNDNDFSSGLTPAVGRLQRLKNLQLTTCRLRSLPDTIGDLQQLEILTCSVNDFSKGLTPAVGRLHRLKKLEVGSCRLRSLPDSIRDLQQLNGLFVNNNQLEDYPRCTLPLKKLFYLDISNEITTLAGQLSSVWMYNHFYGDRDGALVQTLQTEGHNVRSENIKSLRDAIGDLEKISKVYSVSTNREFSADHDAAPEQMLQLEEYGHLPSNSESLGDTIADVEQDTTMNCINSLPVELAFTNLQSLNLDGNPIKEPPVEIWSQGINAIKSYMKAVIPGGDLMYADTLNMIGDTSAGKTSLAQSLLAQLPKPTDKADRTHVLQQHRMNISGSSGHSVLINDFGGHEVYHSVMPIFLPTSGLLILVYDMSNETQDRTVKKWMLTAIAKSNDIRLIIVGTHADLLTEEKRRLELEDQMTRFSSEVLQDAIIEMGAHVNYLQCRINDKTVAKKLKILHELHESLRNAVVRVVTLSCSVNDGGLKRLGDVVTELLRLPGILPVRWCKVMSDMLNKSTDYLYITMDDIAAICKNHFTDDDDSNALLTIMRYLSRSSQIIWLENHPTLKNIIFHSPQKIIDTCKKILHHDNSEYNVAPVYEEMLEQYNKGILMEPLLLELLSANTKNFKRADDELFKVVVKFLEQFNLISHVKNDVVCKQYIVPSKLASTEPPLLQELEEKGEHCLNRVTIRLSFIGSVIPMSLFETSLSSMLTVAGDLLKHMDDPVVWKDGAIIIYDGVFFYTKRVNAVVILTAFSEPQHPSPWKILHPVLKHLNDNVIASWHGTPPSCAVLCPWCARRYQYDGGTSRAAEIKLDLATLVAKDGQTLPSRTCKKCRNTIPRCLCYSTAESGFSSDHQMEIDQWFKKAGFSTGHQMEIDQWFTRVVESERPRSGILDIGSPMYSNTDYCNKSEAIADFLKHLPDRMSRIWSEVGFSSYYFRTKHQIVVHPNKLELGEKLLILLRKLAEEFHVENDIAFEVPEKPAEASFASSVIVGESLQNFGMYLQEQNDVYWISTSHGLVPPENQSLFELPEGSFGLHVGTMGPALLCYPEVGRIRVPTPYVRFSVPRYTNYIDDIMIGPNAAPLLNLRLEDRFSVCEPHSRNYLTNPPTYYVANIFRITSPPSYGTYDELAELSESYVWSYSSVTSEPLVGQVNVMCQYGEDVLHFANGIPIANRVRVLRIKAVFPDVVPKVGHSGCVWARRNSDNQYEAVAITNGVTGDRQFWLTTPLWCSLRAIRQMYPGIFSRQREFQGVGIFLPSVVTTSAI